MTKRTNVKKAAGVGMIAVLLGIVFGAFIIAQNFDLFGTSQNKNDVLNFRTTIQTTMSELAADVRNGSDITLNQASVVNKLKTQYNNQVIALDKSQPDIYTAVTSDLSGSALSGIIDGINNGDRYLAILTNADIKKADGTDEAIGVILDGVSNFGFIGNTKDADAAGLTYRQLGFVVPVSYDTAMKKLASDNVAYVASVQQATLNDGVTSANADVVTLKNVGEQQ